MVHAYFDAWIIGDAFLNEIGNTFFSMHNAAVLNKKQPPYLFQRFNVSAFFNIVSSSVKGLACFINPLVEALNEKQKLPKFIIIIPDKDIISSTKVWEFGSSYVLGAAIHYIVRQIDILLERRKLDLFDKKPGVLLDEYPKVVSIRMLK